MLLTRLAWGWNSAAGFMAKAGDAAEGVNGGIAVYISGGKMV